jgi:hypothetical protein
MFSRPAWSGGSYNRRMQDLAAREGSLGERINFNEPVNEQELVRTASRSDMGVIPYEPAHQQQVLLSERASTNVRKPGHEAFAAPLAFGGASSEGNRSTHQLQRKPMLRVKGGRSPKNIVKSAADGSGALQVGAHGPHPAWEYRDGDQRFGSTLGRLMQAHCVKTSQTLRWQEECGKLLEACARWSMPLLDLVHEVRLSVESCIRRREVP